MTTNTEALLRGTSRENDAHDEAKADRYCDMGVGCGEYGACYAAANGEPERCSRATHPAPTQPEQAKGGEAVATCKDYLPVQPAAWARRESLDWLQSGNYKRMTATALSSHKDIDEGCDTPIYTHPAPAAQNEREANATARAFSLATMAAEEFVRCNGLSTGEPDEFLMTGGYLTDEYATECIEHLKHVGECVAFDCDDGVIVRLGDFTLGSLS